MISLSHWDALKGFLQGLGVDEIFLGDSLPPKLGEFLGLLLKKNEVLNLTAITNEEQALWKHFADSLALLKLEPMGKILDWGSGGGFPGVPLALARMGAEMPADMVFLDSVGKKIRAVEEFCSTLGVQGKFINGRGENALGGRSLHIDTVVMRAVAPADRAVHWLRPSVPRWLFLLGPQQVESWLAQEKKITRAGLQVVEVHSFSLPLGHGERRILELRKK